MVLPAPAANSFDALLSTGKLIKEQKHTPGQRILRIAREPASDRAAYALGLNPDDPVVEIVRVRTANETPVLIEKLVFPLAIGESLLTLNADSESVHDKLSSEGVHVDNVARIARAIAADKEQAELLGIEPGSPLWEVELRASTFQGDPVEYAVHTYRADMVSLKLSNVRGGSIPLKFDVSNPGDGVEWDSDTE